MSAERFDLKVYYSGKPRKLVREVRWGYNVYPEGKIIRASMYNTGAVLLSMLIRNSEPVEKVKVKA